MFLIGRVEKGSVVLRFLISVWFLFFFLVVFAYSVLMIDLLWRPLEGFFLPVPNLSHPNPIQNPAGILVDTGPVAVFYWYHKRNVEEEVAPVSIRQRGECRQTCRGRRGRG